MSEAEQPKEAGREGARLLAGRYRLGAVLGRGGMGTVWRAVDETLGRTVAVKELRFPSAIDEEEKRRLITRTLREAKAIARIRNNGAVTVYDVVNEDDRPWIVMELIEGKSLAEVVRQDGYLTPKRAAEVGLAVLDVLRAAHREGILHRDVKPSNVLIADDDGRVVLTDFGIAQVEGDPSITSTGMLVGAPSYISPERARGHKPGPAADLWSLGGLLYAAVEGVPPYDKGSAIATLTAVMTDSLEPPRNAGRLEKVIYGLLEKDPEQRLDDAGARALLNDVIHAPDPVTEAEAPVEESADATRVVPLPTDPLDSSPSSPSSSSASASPSPGASRRSEAAAERLRGALRSVRNAAAATAATATTAASASTARTTDKAGTAGTAGTEGAGGGAAGAGAKGVARASVTDVVPRRTLLIAAVVVVLAILGTILAFALNDGGSAQDEGKGDQSASSGADAGAGAGAEDEKDKSGDKGQDGDDGAGDGGGDKGKDPEEGQDGGQGSGDSGGDKGSGGSALPAGYERMSDRQFHFSMVMPKDFRRTGTAGQNSGGIYSKSGGFPRVQVDFNSSPGDDAAASWRSLAKIVGPSSENYRQIRIAEIDDYKGYPTVADWAFERDQGGQRVRVLNRGFKVDAKRGYSIMITCKSGEWDGEECATLRKTAFKTFKPEG